MSSTITTTLASASATPTGNAGCRNIYEIPTQDAACAMPFGGNHTEILTKCCGDANVISYYDDCGLYVSYPASRFLNPWAVSGVALHVVSAWHQRKTRVTYSCRLPRQLQRAITDSGLSSVSPSASLSAT